MGSEYVMRDPRDRRNYAELLARGRELLLKQVECFEAVMRGEPPPCTPLTHGQLEQLSWALTHALDVQKLEVKILSTMHKWPQHAIQEWMMRAEEEQERERERLALDAIPKLGGDGTVS